MTPTLTRSGLLVVGVGAALVFAGALATAWPLVALGFAQISAVLLLYVLFIPTCALLRRRHLEFAWWVPASETSGGALFVDRPLTLHLLLRNHAPLSLRLHRVQIISSSTIELETPRMAALLPSRTESLLHVRATPRSAGYWFFHGLGVHVADRFGIFELQLYYPNLMSIKVFPQFGAWRAPIPFRPRTGASHERAGQHLLRLRGLGSDLREIRDHIPGDPFKRIAWKATGRTRRLMVREFESEILVTHWLLLDISSTMRSSLPGRSKLDYALGLCAAFARTALEAGDRVGLATFDQRIYSQVNPGEGRPHLYRIVDRLMELHSIVDEDMTDLTDQELFSAVAEYLAHQEGIDVRLPGPPPRPGDPLGDRLVEGARGEVFDAQVMVETVVSLLRKRQATGASWWWSRVVARSSRAAQLRLFCRLSGLEIPYRQHSPVQGKELGMAAAIQRAGASRHSQLIVLISDLEEVTDPRPVLGALQLARHRHHRLLVVAPFGPSFLPASTDDYTQRVRNIFTLRALRQRRAMKQQVERLGIPVVPAGPRDALPLLLRRLASARFARGEIADP